MTLRHLLSVPCGAREPYTLRRLIPAVVCPAGEPASGREPSGRRERPDPAPPFAPVFGGLLFEAERDDRGGLISPRFLGMAGPASREGWERALGRLFHPARNIGAALAASRLLPEGASLDIWLALPSPPRGQEREFGRVAGRRLRFALRQEDRVTALLWWADGAAARWERLAAAAPGHRCVFRGFVFMRPYLDANDIHVAKRIAEELGSRGMGLLWCSNCGTTPAHGTDARFDGLFLRPTRFGIDSRDGDGSGFPDAADFSVRHGPGVVVWVPDGSPERLRRWLRMGKAHFAGRPHLFELGDWRETGLIDPASPAYHELRAYLSGIGPPAVPPGCAPQGEADEAGCGRSAGNTGQTGREER